MENEKTTVYCCLCGKTVPYDSIHSTGWDEDEGYYCFEHSPDEWKHYIAGEGTRFNSLTGEQERDA